MGIPLLDAVLGALIGAACLTIPQLVRRRRQRRDDDDTQAYLKKTGRSARDIEQANTALRLRQQNDAKPKQAGGPAAH